MRGCAPHPSLLVLQMIDDVNSERDAKLAALERQRQQIIDQYAESVRGVEGELRKTIEFLQVRA